MSFSPMPRTASSQCPMPHAPCPMPHSPMPHSPFPITSAILKAVTELATEH
ncbi:hypothetical protein [Nostoc linckia]|uniref:hypothetical protein n=1 Tax=Nostoc linckia TaxID=92942 RepID=UPI0015D4E71D|nr:hypothetical protein [Nostoc linckia]